MLEGKSEMAIENVSNAWQQAAYWTQVELTRFAVTLRPRLFIDGDQWCALYGENIQDGVAGFGDTPAKALSDFDAAFNKQLTPPPTHEIFPGTTEALEELSIRPTGSEADGPITWREFENDPQSGEDGPWFILCFNGEPWMQVDSYFGTEYLPDWISDYDGDEAQARDNLEHRMRRRCKLANAAIASAANTQNKGSGE